jgi:hypothetical protein
MAITDASLQELRDHLAIVDVVNAVATLADENHWDELRGCFADTVAVDYTSLNGGQPVELAADDLIAGWSLGLSGFDATQHIITNHRVSLEGDQATCRAYVHAQHRLLNATGGPHWTLGGTYTYQLARSSKGWKVTATRLVVSWTEGNQHLLALARERAAR